MASKDIKNIIAMVVAADARLGLAAERLGMSKDEVLRAVVDDTQSLSDQLKVKLLLQLFETLMMTQIAFQATIADMSPDGIARAYASQMQAFAQLSAKPIEVAEEAPVTIMEARNALADKLDKYQDRADNKKEEPVELEKDGTTGT